MPKQNTWAYLTERDILKAYLDFVEYPSENNFMKVIKEVELKIKELNNVMSKMQQS
jgi:hypothetical protein